MHKGVFSTTLAIFLIFSSLNYVLAVRDNKIKYFEYLRDLHNSLYVFASALSFQQDFDYLLANFTDENIDRFYNYWKNFSLCYGIYEDNIDNIKCIQTEESFKDYLKNKIYFNKTHNCFVGNKSIILVSIKKDNFKTFGFVISERCKQRKS